LVYTPEAKIGDYIIVHVGFSIAILDEEYARSTLELFEEKLL
jgi:hydrogenase expression/formation protein HypC